MENNTIEILKVIYKNRKQLLIITGLATIVSVIVTMPFIIKPLYKSTAVVYPANIGALSEESPTEQLMQFFNSKDVQDELLQKFDLAKHYEIDTADTKFDTYYTLYFDEHFKISQTRFESIEIQVLDEDPVLAQKLVYGLIDAVNNHIRVSRNEKTEEFLLMHQTYMKAKERKMDSISSVLKDLSAKYGLLDYFLQVEQFSKNYYKTISIGKNEKLEQALSNLGQKGIGFMNLLDQYKSDLLYYNESKQEYDKGVRDIEKKFTYTILASKPNLPDSKASPKRGIIVVMAAFGAFLFSVLLFAYTAKFKQLKDQIVKE